MHMKKTILFILHVFFVSNLFSQSNQLSIKIGAAKTFAAPSGTSEGFAFKNISVTYPYPTLAVEYAWGKKKKTNVDFYAGVSFQPIWYNGTFNYKNVKPGSLSFTTSSGFYAPMLYTGADIKVRKAKKVMPAYKNYFFITVGGGLCLAGIDKNEHTGFQVQSYGMTYDNKIIMGGEMLLKRAQLPIAPTVFGGIRYHITNSKGKPVVVLELIANYGITRYIDYAVQYEIDNQHKEDRLGEKGINIQLNVIIPIHAFKKK